MVDRIPMSPRRLFAKLCKQFLGCCQKVGMEELTLASSRAALRLNIVSIIPLRQSRSAVGSLGFPSMFRAMPTSSCAASGRVSSVTGATVHLT